MQLVLFGFAINSDPKDLPTAVLVADNSVFSRDVLAALENTNYFRITARPQSEAEVERLLARGEVQFAITIPADFSRKIQRGEQPVLLVEADATDPSATSNAIATLSAIGSSALDRDLTGPLAKSQGVPPPFEVRIHRRYNPEGISQYNVVPGLIGVVLTMTMVIMTSLAMTRERERGTMEMLLATPVRPVEVMIGKIAPYIIVGYIQVSLILIVARLLFEIPMEGDLGLLVDFADRLHRGESVGRLHLFDHRAATGSGDADWLLLLPAVAPAVGFMFPFRGLRRWRIDRRTLR